MQRYYPWNHMVEGKFQQTDKLNSCEGFENKKFNLCYLTTMNVTGIHSSFKKS